ncbi:MAG: DUF4190 domain-containing protein [Anaerolineaceae bacterium]|nr:DUF4190 domain-containing protein [Anaerolineaceae bacterium]
MTNDNKPVQYQNSGRTSTWAILSLVCGLLSYSFMPVLAAILAIVFGHTAKSEIRRSPEQLEGSGLATAGLILGYLQVGLIVVAACVIGLIVLGAISFAGIFANQVVY